ncbi:MAG TPA: hypothetical protein VKY26_09545 [Actinomycetota bacterium]|nr:hypothetical protein [Actinomycetota bacterium]
MAEGARRRFDRIVDPAYLENVQALPIDELRKRKDECEGLEVEISYARRLIQGKLDILRHGAERLADGDPIGVAEMVEDLPGILADGATGSSPRLSRIMAPDNADNQRREVERLASSTDLARLEELSPNEIDEMVNRLAEAEKETSQRRRRIQGVMDQLTGELVRRYREGQEDPTALLSS